MMQRPYSKTVNWNGAISNLCSSNGLGIRGMNSFITYNCIALGSPPGISDGFADRCENLVRKVTSHVEDESARKVFNEQVERILLANFTSGLEGNRGKHTRFSMPSTMKDAMKMAVTVEQVEACVRRYDSFHVNDKARNTHYTSHAAESEEQGRGAPSASHQGRNTRGQEALKCFECGRLGHWAQVCNNQLARTATSDRTATGTSRAEDRRPTRRRRIGGRRTENSSGNY
jgi:hypothetical protein